MADCTHLSLTNKTEALTLFYQHWYAKTCLKSQK